MYEHGAPSSERMQPLVSIVTPAYNALPYLQENIESVRSQDYSPIEHIIIDGGSSDGTRELLESYPHLEWVSEPDRGQSHALNKGFQRAKGEIIGWLNADDTYQPGAVSTAVRFLLEHPQVDLVYSDLQIIDEDSQPVGITRGLQFDLIALLFDNPIKQPTVFMRRRVIEELGGVDESLHYVMDRELWLRAGLASFRMYHLDGHFLANFRLCPGTKSFEQTLQFRSEWLQVLEHSFQSQSFSHVPKTIKKRALQRNRSAYYLSKMVEAIEHGERKRIFWNLILATTKDWKILVNKGTWFLLTQGLLGHYPNRLRRFEN